MTMNGSSILPPDEDATKCNLYNKNNQSTNPYHIQNAYGGIPQNLLTNVIVLSILLILFFLLRKSAWKVLNAFRRDDLQRWTHTFFDFTTNVVTRMGSQRSRRRPSLQDCQRSGRSSVAVRSQTYDVDHVALSTS